MEKDALLERVASVQALISCNTPLSVELTSDQEAISDLRRFLYRTAPGDIDFQAVAKECQVMFEKYQSIEVTA
ncbi:hypothetical protein D0T92_04080 [Neisseria zalophi]|uniref:Uncharacterized protein n=2 Tax=Neisseria zalophi TaxID=640030 RepID=A0A5J6Q1B0_9NEIS|nr:hypothetical protein D0T92_04080 [Neisseria zalophi]